MNEIKYNLTRESLTFIYEGKSYSVQRDAANFPKLREALLSEQWDEVPKHLTIGKSLAEWARGEFVVEGNSIRYRDDELPHDLNGRIIDMANRGEDPTPLFKFWERLQKNPSMRSVEQLWAFLQHTNIPLTTNGTFYAYKGVRSDYKDAHSGKIDNSPGAINRMPRNKISDDPNVECHFGFHVGALSYARNFSQQVVICEVDPEYVVCVPYDHRAQKMRVCEYKVVGNYGSALPSLVIIPDTEVKEFVDSDVEDYDNVKDAPESTHVDDDEEEAEDDRASSVDAAEEENDDVPDLFDHTHADADRETAKAKKREEETAKRLAEKEAKEAKEKAKAEREETRKERVTDSTKMATDEGYGEFAAMNMPELMKQSIEDLRKYAANGLKIVGASKIPGGKVELIKTVIKVRKRVNK